MGERCSRNSDKKYLNYHNQSKLFAPQGEIFGVTSLKWNNPKNIFFVQINADL